MSLPAWTPAPEHVAPLVAARAEASASKIAGRAHAVLASLLNRAGLTQEARAALRLAAQLPQGTVEDAEALGFTAFALGEHALAANFYREVTARVPGDAQGWYNLATALRNLGALDEADAACARSLACDPGMAQARLLQSQLRRASMAHNHVSQLRKALELSRGNLAALISLHYALGKELDDLGDHDAAFAHFTQGAALRRGALQYDVGSDLAKLARIEAVFHADCLAAAPPLAGPPDALFVLGLPRSGTTMVERVLNGEGGAASNGETDNLMLALLDGMAASGADVFERVGAADPAKVRASYTSRAGIAPGRPVIEKLPMNYLYAGAIRLTLPGARIVRLRRGAMDNLFAMYSTLFGTAYPFSYDLGELADYMIALERLMTHWADCLGPQWLDVGYEAFVMAPEPLGEQVAAHCGLAWDKRMLRIEENRAPTATASAAQVRQPIHRGAVGRWRAYERHLLPIAERLAKAGLTPEP